MSIRNYRIISLVIVSLFYCSCIKPSYPPIRGFITTGSYFYITKETSPSKAWAKLAGIVAKSISKTVASNFSTPVKSVYISYGKNTLFEKNYRELLATAMVKENFRISKKSDANFLVTFDSYIMSSKKEVIINTSLYYQGRIIFRDSSVLNLSNDITVINDYKLKLTIYKKMPLESDYKVYRLVDK